MSNSVSTPVAIRVQAHDGMFLGPDSYQGAQIIIRDAQTQQLLASGKTNNGDSGIRASNFTDNASSSLVVTPDKAGASVYWVVASDTTVKYTTVLSLNKPTLLQIDATVPLPAEQGDQIVSVTQWINPGEPLTTGAGFVINVPGLWVQPQTAVMNNLLLLTATVTMMCGCKIEEGSPWIPQDFEVVAKVLKLGATQPAAVVKLMFQDTSVFSKEIAMPETGTYTVIISAVQKSTTNQAVVELGLTID